MKKQTLDEAIRVARTFLTKATLAQSIINQDPSILYSGSKFVAAMKRASMDLTRALAELRKP